MLKDNDFKGLLRWVHSPVEVKDVYSIITERKPFQSTSVYRILHLNTKSKGGYHEDVVTPLHHLHKNKPKEAASVKLFYRGAEEALDRYIRWLYRYRLRSEYDLPPALYVFEQLTALAQEELDEQLGPYSSTVIGPSDYSLFGVLTAEKEGRLFLF